MYERMLEKDTKPSIDEIYSLITDPEVIRTACEEANVGLLLDIAHARVAA